MGVQVGDVRMTARPYEYWVGDAACGAVVCGLLYIFIEALLF